MSAAPASSRIAGTVKYYNAAQGYGYITGPKGDYYFRRENLRFPAAPVGKGDRVTFSEAVVVAENAGMPKALRIDVEGYTAPTKAPAAIPSDRIAAAKAAADKERAALKKARQQRRAAHAANRAAFKDLFAAAPTLPTEAPVETAAPVGDYMDAFYEVPADDDDLSQQQRDVRSLLGGAL